MLNLFLTDRNCNVLPMDSDGAYLKEDAYSRKRRLNNAAHKRFWHKKKLQILLGQWSIHCLGRRNRDLRCRVQEMETGYFLIGLCIRHLKFINLSLWMHKLGLVLRAGDVPTLWVRIWDLMKHKGLIIREVKRLFNRVRCLINEGRQARIAN